MVVNTQSKKIIDYEGLSTDTKPVLQEENTGSSFFEVDTGNLFKWNKDKWYQL